MRRSDKERLKQLFESTADQYDRSAAYNAIAAAERDERDPKTKQLLHDAALELVRSDLDKTQLDAVRQLLDAIEPES